MQSIKPKRFLHWVFRITNLKSTLGVLSQKLGVKVQRHQQFALKCDATCNGNYQNPWSKTMAALGSQKSHFALELVQNYGVEGYESNNTHFQNLEFFDPDYKASGFQQFHLDNKSYNCLKYGPLYFTNYSKLSPLLNQPLKKDYSFVTINVKSLQNSRDYYEKLLKFTVFAEWKGDASKQQQSSFTQEWISMNKNPFIIIGYGQDQTKIKLVETGKDVIQTGDSGRMAFTTPQSVQLIKSVIEESGDKIEHQPVTLQTPGKADVIVIILKDRDGYEICFVEELGFHDLCTTKPGDEVIDWELRDKQLEKLNAMKKAFGKE